MKLFINEFILRNNIVYYIWRVFNTMDARQYANLLRETIEEYGCPAIFNTDQGSQFTSDVFIKVIVDYDIQISMDGKDRALDNIRIERL